jgi:hypothetical protein
MAKSVTVKWRSTAGLFIQGLDAATKRLPVVRAKYPIVDIDVAIVYQPRRRKRAQPSKSLRAGPGRQLF